jgi:restriction endonuclease
MEMTESMPTPQLKGTALEIAVHAIENMILRESPSYNEKTFSFDLKKIVTVAGVRHEIDIWVSVDLGNGYTALFISECKNWADKVGKNEIIVLSEKIDAVQAQRGFFFAKAFTADAEAQATKDPRIVLRQVTDLPAADHQIPSKLHGIFIEGVETTVHFFGKGATAETYDTQEQVDLGAAILVVGGRETTTQEYVNAWALSERDKCVNAFPSQEADEGFYDLRFDAERSFAAGEVILNGAEMAGSRLAGTVRVRVTKARIISHFEVQTRGRALTVALDLAGTRIIAAFVKRLPSQP